MMQLASTARLSNRNARSEKGSLPRAGDVRPDRCLRLRKDSCEVRARALPSRSAGGGISFWEPAGQLKRSDARIVRPLSQELQASKGSARSDGSDSREAVSGCQ